MELRRFPGNEDQRVPMRHDQLRHTYKTSFMAGKLGFVIIHDDPMRSRLDSDLSTGRVEVTTPTSTYGLPIGEFTSERPQLVIGRDMLANALEEDPGYLRDDAGLAIRRLLPTISRNHVAVSTDVRASGHFGTDGYQAFAVIRDLNSTNGTFGEIPGAVDAQRTVFPPQQS